MPRIALVVGARPNFVKAAPVVRALAALPEVETLLIHTGQHYDEKLSDVFFADLGLPAPDLHLEVGSRSHAEQTAEVMRRIEAPLVEHQVDLVVVFGDVNSTVAAAITAAKLRIPVAHVEAGLRSFDNDMPEEINRRLTDCVSDLLFTTEESGSANLLREGVAPERIHFVGNTMVDSLYAALPQARSLQAEVLERLNLEPQKYGVLTLHRPSNVDHAGSLEPILRALRVMTEDLPVVFPAHPRTLPQLKAAGGSLPADLRVISPMGYLEFVALMDGARIVLTDSGGIQEETTALGVPCITLRENTERPVTVSHGTNRLAGCDTEAILEAVRSVLEADTAPARPSTPPLWDGASGARIAEVLHSWLERG